MGRERAGINFWKGFEKRAGLDLPGKLVKTVAGASAKHNSPTQKILRGAGYATLGAGALGYAASRQKEGDLWYGNQG